MFRFIFVVLFGVCLSTASWAQIGVSAHYLNGEADKWDVSPSSTLAGVIEMPGSGWQAGLDYWFRLKNLRIEFLPTLAVSQQEKDLITNVKSEMRAYHLFINTNFYLFDFKGDCDCPTFSKQGPSLQKGVFLQLSPGYSVFNYTVLDSEAGFSVKNDDSGLSIGLALGLDLGLSDFVTISPIIGARYYPTVEWEALALDTIFTFPATPAEAESSLLQYTAGIRLGFRFDQ
ncbi:MAG: hypothetical protein AAGJ93_00370 [Bacteroidota bacterium]